MNGSTTRLRGSLGSFAAAWVVLGPTLTAWSWDEREHPVAPITPEGARLAAELDRLEIEKYWLPGRAVHWRSGEVDPEGRQRATHCSAFAAAACDRLGVYLLRPPDHAATLLANAQNAWLNSTIAADRGWVRLPSAIEAQASANAGRVVVASFANPNRRKPGHIAVVRPALVTREQVERDGPRIMQAGSENLRDATLKRGFSKHPEAFRDGRIEFFAHDASIPDSKRAEPPPGRTSPSPNEEPLTLETGGRPGIAHLAGDRG
ncbi:MAG: hypothetical protein SFX72_16575 [Isosphaeraceae bacterium]|nr:hypothetical protein [Isosphaeraceae bacterium]